MPVVETMHVTGARCTSCKNVLIAGATSVIGQAITKKFTDGNHILLLCRDREKHRELSSELTDLGALSVVIIELDLSNPPSDLTSIDDQPVDIFINVACATSRLRDARIEPTEVTEQAMTDLLTPLQIVQHIVEHNSRIEETTGIKRHLKVIFVSTILASFISPNRRIYSSYKILQEEYLRRLVTIDNESMSLLVVRIATFISPEKNSTKAERLADGIYNSNNEDRTEYVYGLSGRLLKALFFIQPYVFMLALSSLRNIRRWLGDPIK